MNLKFLETKKVLAGFALTALFGGFIFLNKGITGNVVLTNKYPFDVVSFIGFLLVICSITIAMYIRKKK